MGGSRSSVGKLKQKNNEKRKQQRWLRVHLYFGVVFMLMINLRPSVDVANLLMLVVGACDATHLCSG